MSRIEPLLSLLQNKGGARYGGEAVTQLQHALQAAHLAEREGAPASQIAAALLHDIGHLQVDDDGLAARGKDARHERAGAALLKHYFGPSVTDPVRLHVDAKRYLCTTNPDYHAALSAASVTSLKVQGGPYSSSEAEVFAARPFAKEAVALRRWDDLAKDPAAKPPSLEHFAETAEALSHAWQKGRLVMVVGPSGAGKDTLIRAAAERLADDPTIHFPKRVVTRPRDSAREEHESLTPAAFRALEEQGGFCLSWEAHGLSYGIPLAVLTWLERGETLVINASRTLVAAASRRFPYLDVIHVTASPTVIAERLAARPGTPLADTKQRLDRNLDWKPSDVPLQEVATDGALQDNLEAFLTLLKS